MRFTENIIKQAYRYVKSYAYNDNINLFLKPRVAKFELNNFDGNIITLCEILNDPNPLDNEHFKTWVNGIEYNLLPKNVIRPEDIQNEEVGLFLSNVRTSKKYTVEKINYFIDAPIEIHIIEMLWTLIAGPLLEKNLSIACYGNRLSEQALMFNNFLVEKSEKLKFGIIFKRYIDQYNAWRDKAIDCAKNNANENVAILSLDLKSYFYHIDISFEDIIQHIKEVSENNELSQLACLMTTLLKRIYKTYSKCISSSLATSHPDCKDKMGLPIGFASSSLLANWCLREFDDEILDSVRPAYYGRYVDDIILVFKRLKLDKNLVVRNFIKKYLPKLFIIENKDIYKIISNSKEYPVQKEKIIFYYFDKEHSLAVLEIFKKKLEERSSAFKFLPDDHIESELNKFAYDLIYNGSINKLRNVIDLVENGAGLSHYLTSHIMAHRLCKLNKKEQVLPQIELFFKGVNILQFSHLWEKVYQYAIIVDRQDFAISFYKRVSSEIDKLDFYLTAKNEKITSYLREDLEIYNKIALSLCLGLLDAKTYNQNMIKENIPDMTLNLRRSNLIKHHLVAWSLANFSTYEGDLTDEEAFRKWPNNNIDHEKISFSPRFIHFDEWQLFYLNRKLQTSKDVDFVRSIFQPTKTRNWLKDALDEYIKLNFIDNLPISITS